MKFARVSVPAIALLIAAAPFAGAQVWGGGGPGISPPPAPTYPSIESRFGYPFHGQVIVLYEPYYYSYRSYRSHRHAATPPMYGGSWDGRRPDIRGSPPVRPVDPTPAYRDFFGYVDPRYQPTNAPAVEYRRTRDAYREHYGRR